MAATEYLETQILNHLLGTASWTKPAALYIGLLTATPEDDGGAVEVAADEYARVQRDPGDANWPAQPDGRRALALAAEFADPLSDWGTVTAAALFDAATAGTMLCYAVLDSAKTVSAGGATLIIQPGAMSWRMNDL